MQKRHIDRATYFKELSITSREYFIPYILKWHTVEQNISVLEIGCGEGGNLLPFSLMGCHTVGVDMAIERIKEANSFFNEAGAKGTFIANDIFKEKGLEHNFDIVICHDVIEHIADKRLFLAGLSNYLKPNGVIFMAFPAWQMPFGGHQQICRSNLLSHFPFIHLLPANLYRLVLRALGENNDCINELLSIKQTHITIEKFEDLLMSTDLCIKDRQLWLINPHYKVKFGLKPRKLHPFISAIPYLRDVFSTSCFYILKRTALRQNSAH